MRMAVYKDMKWPDDYWPKTAEPTNDEGWEKSIAQIREDRKAFEKLLKARMMRSW